jgi:hypothetical protein
MTAPIIKRLNGAQKVTLEKLEDLELLLRQQKPGDRSEEDRRIALMITETNKLKALYVGLILAEEPINE